MPLRTLALFTILCAPTLASASPRCDLSIVKTEKIPQQFAVAPLRKVLGFPRLYAGKKFMLMGCLAGVALRQPNADEMVISLTDGIAVHEHVRVPTEVAKTILSVTAGDVLVLLTRGAFPPAPASTTNVVEKAPTDHLHLHVLAVAVTKAPAGTQAPVSASP